MTTMPEGNENAALPPGTKNYITPIGYAKLQAELHRLARVDRPKVVETVSWAAGNGDRSENADYIFGKKRLHEIDRRIRWLAKRLEIAEVVDPAQQKNRGRIYFGATVDYGTEDDAEHTVTILGVDEADIARGEASLFSPIARALLGAGVGDVVSLHTPGGIRKVEILAIRYPK
jgi:transcription elongation factor GreB